MGTAILVIEDDNDTIELIKTGLAEKGFFVTAANNLYSALDALKSAERTDAVLLDYNMPGMRAEEFLAKVHSLRPEMPIVLMSAVVNAQEKARQLGLPCYIQKPFTIEQLDDLLQRARKADSAPLTEAECAISMDAQNPFFATSNRAALEIAAPLTDDDVTPDH